MTTKQLIISSFIRFKDLKEARNVPFWKAIVYLLVLSIIMALPISFQVFQVLNNIQLDGQKIATRIPDFTIQNGQLQTEEKEGFIYQTNSIIFTFDPEGKRTEQDISTDLMGNFVSVGMLKNLTGKQLRSFLSEASIPLWIKVLTFIFSIYPSFLNLLITLLFTNIAAFLYARFRLTKATFLDCLKTLIYSISLPTIIATILMVFLPSFDTSAFIAFAGIFIFAQAVKGWAKISIN